MTLPPGCTGAERLGGGYINEAFRVRLGDGREAFVKTRSNPMPGEYAAEAAGLQWLGSAGGLAVPPVLELDERYLALAWVQPGSLDGAGAELLGQGLAAIHAAGAPCFGDPGWLGPARFGELLLPNDPTEDWPKFYAQRRLEPLARVAGARRALSPAGQAAVAQICAAIEELAGPAEPPARLHGDLWGGNVMADSSGRPWLIDPSAYGGHREVDLAMLRLFGGVPERTFSAYEEAWPLAPGWERRVALYQLLPLLVHAVLFGGSYGPAAERAALSLRG